MQPQRETPTADVGPAFNITEYVQLVLSRWPLILAITLLGAMAGLGHYYMTPKLYRATTVIQIERLSNTGVGTLNPWLEEWSNAKYYPTQYWLLRSRGLAERAVLDLRLMEDPAFYAGAPQSDESGLQEDAVNIVDEQVLASLGRRIAGNLTVSPIEGTEMVQLTYVSSNPELAAKIVNGITSTYIEWGIEKRNTSIGQATSFLEQQIETLKLQIEDKEKALHQFSRDADMVNLDPESNTSLGLLEQLNQGLTQAVATRLEKEAEYRSLLAASPEDVVEQGGSPQVGDLQRTLSSLERDYERKLDTYKPEWPEMVDLRREIESQREDLNAVTQNEAEKIRRRAYAEFQSALRHERSIETQIDETKEDVFAGGSVALEYRNLVMEISSRRDLLDQLLKQQSEAGVSVRLSGPRKSNVRVVDRALVPGSPFRPSLRNDLSTSVAVSFALGIGLVLLIHFLDRTIKNPGELERLLGVPVLAVIPDVSSSAKGGRYGYYSYYSSSSGKGRRRGQPRSAEAESLEIELLPNRRPKIGVSEAYRSLRTALLLSSADVLKVVTVTSAGAGEGKTATATNLAVVMAQLGKRVLVIDADLRKPRVNKVFGLTNRIGLVNYLTAGAKPEEILQPSGIENLTVCPCGPHPPNPSELLASDRLTDFLTFARNSFDFVIVDSPPVLAVTDAIIAGAITDGVVLCSRAHKVQRDEAKTCIDQLRLSEVRVLGAVLNAYRPVRSGYHDKKYYYYESYSERATEPAPTPQRSQRTALETRMGRRRIRIRTGLSILMVAGIVGSASLQAADPFYENLLRNGELAYLRGDYQAASESLRIACFGLLDEPEVLAEGLVKLGLASVRLGDDETFQEVFERMLEIEERFGAYSAAQISDQDRAEFQEQLTRRVPAEVLQRIEAFRPVESAGSIDMVEVGEELSLKEQRAALEAQASAEPASLTPRLALARLELDSGRPKRAIHWAEDVLALEPSNEQAVCLRGEASLESGSCRDAAADLERCESTSDTAILAVGYLRCLVKLDRETDAARFYVSLPEASRQSQSVSSVASRISDEAIAEAMEASRGGSVAAGQTPAGAAESIQPTAIGPSDSDQAELRSLEADLAVADSTAEVTAILGRAKALSSGTPGWREAELFAAKVAYHASRWNESVALFRSAGGPDASSPEMLFYYAVALFEAGEPKQARLVLEQALPLLVRDPFVDSYVERIMGQDS